MRKRWKPTVAGILSIISAPFVLTLGMGGALQGHTLMGQLVFWGFASLAIVAMVGGVFAIRRKVWGLALAGSICAVLFGSFGFLENPMPLTLAEAARVSSIPGAYLGTLAIIFIALSKKEFE